MRRADIVSVHRHTGSLAIIFKFGFKPPRLYIHCSPGTGDFLECLLSR